MRTLTLIAVLSLAIPAAHAQDPTKPATATAADQLNTQVLVNSAREYATAATQAEAADRALSSARAQLAALRTELLAELRSDKAHAEAARELEDATQAYAAVQADLDAILKQDPQYIALTDERNMIHLELLRLRNADDIQLRFDLAQSKLDLSLRIRAMEQRLIAQTPTANVTRARVADAQAQAARLNAQVEAQVEAHPRLAAARKAVDDAQAKLDQVVAQRNGARAAYQAAAQVRDAQLNQQNALLDTYYDTRYRYYWYGSHYHHSYPYYGSGYYSSYYYRYPTVYRYHRPYSYHAASMYPAGFRVMPSIYFGYTSGGLYLRGHIR